MELESKSFGEIKGLFIVPSYQRGYRWGEIEVTRLIDDIYQNGSKSYCLQPIVVKQLHDGKYELIDGQQRLTTIYILLTYMKREEYKPRIEIPFEIEYSIRKGSADFLKNITEEKASEYIDYWYIYQTYSTIGNWISRQQNPSSAVDDIYGYLVKNVKIIWYEVDETIDGIALFERLNIGKIPLTNSELVKALFLSSHNVISNDKKDEIAFQWDEMEKTLQDDSVWYFLASKNNNYSTRMDLLLDFISEGKYKDDKYGTFFELQALVDEKGYDELWKKITAAFNQIIDWYEDSVYYHKIGYLVTVGALSIKQIFDFSKKCITKDAFMDNIDKEIRKSVAINNREYSDLTYENKTDYDCIYRILLLFNILSVMNTEGATLRFPFALFRKGSWSLEHIHAQQSEGLATERSWREWLEEHLKVLKKMKGDNLALIDEIKHVLSGKIKTETFKEIHERVVECFSATEDDGSMHGISNLALLGFEDNAALNNSVFSVKRNIIIKKDKNGDYIPLCTKNVFLKYYSSDDDTIQLYFWGPSDRRAYVSAINEVLKDYLCKEI